MHVGHARGSLLQRTPCSLLCPSVAGGARSLLLRRAPLLPLTFADFPPQHDLPGPLWISPLPTVQGKPWEGGACFSGGGPFHLEHQRAQPCHHRLRAWLGAPGPILWMGKLQPPGTQLLATLRWPSCYIARNTPVGALCCWTPGTLRPTAWASAVQAPLQVPSPWRQGQVPGGGEEAGLPGDKGISRACCLGGGAFLTHSASPGLPCHLPSPALGTTWRGGASWGSGWPG